MFESQIIFKRGVDLKGCKCFRIPFGAVTKGGTWIVGADARYTCANDFKPIDIAIRRSLDGGETWLDPQVIFERNHPTDGSRKMDGCIVADQVTGKLFIFCVSYGMGNPIVDQTIAYDFIYRVSEDEGESWGPEISLKSLCEDGEEIVFQGPGSGIQMMDDTLVIPAQKWRRGERDLLPTTRSSIIYSKDQGKSWKIGQGVDHFSTEATVVETKKGELMLICRNEDRNEPNRGKKVYVSQDMGESWIEHPTTDKIRQYNTCMGSALKFRDRTGEEHILFSGPNNYSLNYNQGRSNITLQKLNASQTDWELVTKIHVPPSQGYSCLVYDGTRHKLFIVLETTETEVGKDGDPNNEVDTFDPHSYMDIEVRDLTGLLPSLKRRGGVNKNIGTPLKALGEGIEALEGKEPRIAELREEIWIKGSFRKNDKMIRGEVIGVLPDWVTDCTGSILPIMAWCGEEFRSIYGEIEGRNVILGVECSRGPVVLHMPETRIGVFRPKE